MSYFLHMQGGSVKYARQVFLFDLQKIAMVFSKL
jgi:hypothetical protein